MDVSNWLQFMYDTVTAIPGYENVFSEPWRISNCDETQIKMDAETKGITVFAPRGARRVYWKKRGTTQGLTLMITGSADGHLFPPFIVMPGDESKDPKKESKMETHFIKDAGFIYTKNGWMHHEAFFKFTRWFVRELMRREVQLQREDPSKSLFPHLLVMDGFGAHTWYVSADFAKQNQIEFFQLPANCTKMAQPLDVSFMSPLKDAWFAALEKYRGDDIGKGVTRKNFAEIYVAAHEEMCGKPEAITSGFRVTGIYPFNVDEPFSHPELYTNVVGTEPIDDMLRDIDMDRPVRRFQNRSLLKDNSPSSTSLAKRLSKYVAPESHTNRISTVGLATVLVDSKTGRKSVKVHKMEDDLANEAIRQKVKNFKYVNCIQIFTL